MRGDPATLETRLQKIERDIQDLYQRVRVVPYTTKGSVMNDYDELDDLLEDEHPISLRRTITALLCLLAALGLTGWLTLNSP